MLLEGAIGDAYGAGFELARSEKIDSKNLVASYEAHPVFKEIKGKYTDDKNQLRKNNYSLILLTW